MNLGRTGAPDTLMQIPYKTRNLRIDGNVFTGWVSNGQAIYFYGRGGTYQGASIQGNTFKSTGPNGYGIFFLQATAELTKFENFTIANNIFDLGSGQWATGVSGTSTTTYGTTNQFFGNHLVYAGREWAYDLLTNTPYSDDGQYNRLQVQASRFVVGSDVMQGTAQTFERPAFCVQASGSYDPCLEWYQDVDGDGTFNESAADVRWNLGQGPLWVGGKATVTSPASSTSGPAAWALNTVSCTTACTNIGLGNCANAVCISGTGATCTAVGVTVGCSATDQARLCECY